MASTIQVDIVSAEGEIFSGQATMVFAPASQGDVGIAPRHAPLITTMRPGEVRVQREEGEELFFFVTGGALEVQPYQVTVLADTAAFEAEGDAEQHEQRGPDHALIGGLRRTRKANARRRDGDCGCRSHHQHRAHLQERHSAMGARPAPNAEGMQLRGDDIAMPHTDADNDEVWRG